MFSQYWQYSAENSEWNTWLAGGHCHVSKYFHQIIDIIGYDTYIADSHGMPYDHMRIRSYIMLALGEILTVYQYITVTNSHPMRHDTMESFWNYVQCLSSCNWVTRTKYVINMSANNTYEMRSRFSFLYVLVNIDNSQHNSFMKIDN